MLARTPRHGRPGDDRRFVVRATWWACVAYGALVVVTTLAGVIDALTEDSVTVDAAIQSYWPDLPRGMEVDDGAGPQHLESGSMTRATLTVSGLKTSTRVLLAAGIGVGGLSICAVVAVIAFACRHLEAGTPFAPVLARACGRAAALVALGALGAQVLTTYETEEYGRVTDDVIVNVGFNIAKERGITREEMDAWAFRSHQRAVAAIDAGQFNDEIVPVQARLEGEVVEFAVDEHPRRGGSLEKLASLKPVRDIEGFTITAGNSSGVNDAASALAIVSDDLARERGLTPLAKIRAWGAVGVQPHLCGVGGVDAIPLVLKRAGLSVSDVDLWEINEAFASVPIAAVKELGIDEEKVNPFGSGCSLGHPISASGGRMVATLAHELKRRGGGIAVASMCAAGGQGGAVAIESV